MDTHVSAGCDGMCVVRMTVYSFNRNEKNDLVFQCFSDNILISNIFAIEYF